MESSENIHELWWGQIVRGVAAIGYALVMLAWPGITLTVIAIAFASLFAVLGVIDVITGIHGMSKNFSAILRVLLGMLELSIVIFLFRNAGSGLTFALMGLLMAVNLVIMAVVMIFMAFSSTVPGGYRWALGLGGLITLFIGITVARIPVISVTTVIYVLAVFGLFVGPIEIASGLILRSHLKKAEQAAA